MQAKQQETIMKLTQHFVHNQQVSLDSQKGLNDLPAGSWLFIASEQDLSATVKPSQCVK